MAWITGTATDFKDLLNQLQSNAASNGWTVQRYTTGGASPYTDELIMQGPGFGAGYEVEVGIKTFESPVDNTYCWQCYGFTAYDSSRILENMVNISAPVYTRLWNAGITFWMSITDRRIIVVAKCSNTYHSLYMGFFDPFSSPVEYPYPYYLAADASTVGPFGALDDTVHGIAAPAAGAGYIRAADGNWRSCCVHNGAGGFVGFSGSTYTIWPSLVPGNNAAGQFGYPPGARFQAQPGTTDVFPMFNCYIFAMFNKGGVLGVLEGVYWTAGNALSAEQELTVDADTYQVFIEISRSIESPTSFYAVKEA